MYNLAVFDQNSPGSLFQSSSVPYIRTPSPRKTSTPANEVKFFAFDPLAPSSRQYKKRTPQGCWGAPCLDLPPKKDHIWLKSCWISDKEDQIRNFSTTKAFRSSEFYPDMLKSQNHSCYICGRQFDTADEWTGKPIKANVDHCHCCGKVRKLLCTRCNAMLSWWLDVHYRAATDYRKRECTCHNTRIKKQQQ